MAEPQELRNIVTLAGIALRRETRRLQRADVTPTAWERNMQRLLAKFHVSAFVASGKTPLNERAKRLIAGDLDVQLNFLKRFGLQIQKDKDFKEGWLKRAESYANSVKVPYWRGATMMLPLPAMPGQGTQCGGNCKCLWDIKTLDDVAGDYDAFWVLAPAEHCQTCSQRATEWAPVEIRGGELQ